MKTKLLLALMLFAQVTSTTAQDFSHILDEVELIPVMINGEPGNRINIVFLNKWNQGDTDPYNKPELKDEFLKDIDESLIAALTYGHKDAYTAFSHYKEYFNVYALWWPTIPEWRNGVGQDEVEYLIKELFLPWEDEYTGWVTMLIMPNSSNGGGGAGRDLEIRKGSAVIAGNGIDKMLHEISHTCMSIGDEYTTHATGLEQLPTYSATREYRREEIKWRKWIDDETPVPTPYTKEYVDKVGAFEGNQYHLVGYFRPSAQGCIMGSGVFDNTPHMCVTCNQRVTMRINTLVNIINSTTPANKDITIDGAKSLTFAVDHIKPTPNSQVVRWFLNDKLIEMNKDEITVAFGDLKDYRLVCQITDESEYIRPDPPYAAYPVREVEWNITNSSAKSASESLTVKISESKGTLSASVKGGTAPYTYIWGDGSDSQTIKNATSGIYNLTVIDSEYKTGKVEYTIYEKYEMSLPKEKNSSKIAATVNTFSPKDGQANGRIIITAPEGSNYSYLWEDQKSIYGKPMIYEAEDCVTTLSKETKEFWTASNGEYVTFNEKEGIVTWNINVAKEGVYPVEIIYATMKKLEYPTVTVYANNEVSKQEIRLSNTLPHHIGWASKKVYVKFNTGDNTFAIKSQGKSLPNLDYIRIPDSYADEKITTACRGLLVPGTYSVAISDQAGNVSVETIELKDNKSFEIEKLEVVAKGKKGVAVKSPVKGYTYQWYANDTPALYINTPDAPLAVGTEFYPTEPGNYYLSVRDANNTESTNRIGFAVAQKVNSKITPISPATLSNDEMIMWYDASDLNADGTADFMEYESGPIKWDDKSKSSNKSGKITANYYPNKLNGLAVCGWDKEWVSPSGKAVMNYQTVIMVYKERDVSFKGTSPFRGLMNYIGKADDTSKALFDEGVSSKTKNGRTFLNGAQVDPFKTANPMDYCTLTVELESPATDNAGTTEGFWEGDVAEIIMVNRKLTDKERKGIEEYLRLKWFSGIELEF